MANIPVYLVEGEKDADALIYLGFVATTAPQGATNFDKSDVAELNGLNVVAIADRDEAGQAWARQVYHHAGRATASLTFKWAAVGKDVSDHIAAQLPITELADPPEGFPYENDKPRNEDPPQEPPGEPPTTTDDADEPDDEPQAERTLVEVTNPAEAADWLRNELGRGELSGIFRREDLLVHTPRMGEDGYIPAEKLGLKDAGPAQVRPISTDEVKALIDARCIIWKWVGRGDNRVQVPALFPTASAKSACDAARIGEAAVPNIRTLHGVTHTPTIRPDGTILDEAGYDDQTGILYLPDDAMDMPPIPDNPTLPEIKAAVDLILLPINEFPFVTQDDRASWIGLAFTPALRPLLPPPYQMGVITATNPGSGKTLLTSMLTALHGGVQRGEMPRDDDELRKSITAALVDTTAPIVVFDNLAAVVKSPVLDSLLTCKTWSDRWLGQNRQVTAPNDRLWLATGNNAQFGGDLGRRIVTVKLDPPTASHHMRTDFEIKNLHNWMDAHRGEYLAALLTLARGWINAGKPSKQVRSDDFALWVESLRGLMEWAGILGTFGGDNAEALTEDDEEWFVFLTEVYAAVGSDSFTVKGLMNEFPQTNSYGDIRGEYGLNYRFDPTKLPGDLTDRWSHIRDGKDQGFRKSLGKWLANREGRYAAKWKLVGVGIDSHSKAPKYAVRPPTPQAEG